MIWLLWVLSGIVTLTYMIWLDKDIVLGDIWWIGFFGTCLGVVIPFLAGLVWVGSKMPSSKTVLIRRRASDGLATDFIKRRTR